MKFQNRQDLDQARAAYKKALELETKKILICIGHRFGYRLAENL